MKRNLITEITEIKARSEFNSREDFNSRLNDIESAFIENLNYNGDYNKELLKYIPIATVACFEAFFRSVYKELVDSGKPFSDNVINFNQAKNVKFDFEIVNAIQNKTVTVGEFISHILPCNNFDDINSNLSILAGNDFLEQIKKFEKQSVSNNDTIEFIANLDQIILDIKRTFQLRHIFCHEFATNLKTDKEEVLKCFKSAKLFLNQTNDFIWDLLYPNSPTNQTEINIQATESFKKLELELSELVVTIKDASKDYLYLEMDSSAFDKTIVEWKKYREVKAHFDSSCVEGGTMYSLFYANSLSTTTEEKINSLKREFEIQLRKYENIK
jgi:hypothetical protein